MSSVNWSEVLQKALGNGVTVARMRDDLEALGLRIVPFDADDAAVAAELWPRTKRPGLSLGDRACLATGIRTKATVLTTDRSWSRLELGVKVQAIRT